MKNRRTVRSRDLRTHASREIDSRSQRTPIPRILRKPTGLFLVLFGAIALGFFYKTFWYGALPIPTDALVGLYHPWRDLYADTNPQGIPFKNFLTTDPVRQQIPWRKIALEEWKAGRVPTWNPYSFSGTPLSANIQAGVYYPFNVLFFFLDFPIAWTVLIMLQPLLAGLFLFVYLRHHDIHPIAALLGALAWSFSGFHIAWLTWGTIGHVSLWLPLILLAIDKILQNTIDTHTRRKRIAWSVILVFSLLSQLLAGHAQISLYVMMVSACYAAWRWSQRMSERTTRVNVFWFTGGLLAFIVLSSIQWLPMMRLVFESGRLGEVGSFTKPGWFLPWQHLVQFIAPDFFGNPATLNYWGEWNYGEFIGYIGIIPLVFAFFALINRCGKETVFWIVMGFASLLLVLPTPIAKLPYQLQIPIVSSLQPTRLLMVVDLSFVVLAALGLDQWLKKREKPWLSVGIIAAALVVLWIVATIGSRFATDNFVRTNFAVSRRNLMLPTALFSASFAILLVASAGRKKKLFFSVCTMALVGVAVFDLIRFGWKFTPFSPREYFFPQTEVISFLQKQEKPFRIMSIDKRILPPNTASFYGIESIEGYDPIIPTRYEELLAAVARGKPDIAPPFGFNRIITLENLETRLLRILGVSFVLSLDELESADVTQVFREGETRVYEIVPSSPRVYIAEQYLERNTKDDVVSALFDPLFEPGKHAVVEEPIPVVPSAPLETSERVALVTYEAPRIDILVTAHEISRLLVVSNTYAPGWHASLDGKPVKVYRVNYIFGGVIVPPGEHRVQIEYQQF